MVRPSARGRIRPLPAGASSSGTIVGDEIDWPTNATPGGGVTVEDEGTPLATTATTLDFVGAGVTASGTGTTKTITIGGGGGGGDVVSAGSGTGTIVIPGLAGSPDQVPASPHAFDDEFGAYSGWTSYGSPDVAGANGAGYLNRARIQKTSVPGIAGIYKTCPSIPFTLTARVADVYGITATAQWGIMLTASSPGASMLFGPANTSSYTLYACVFSSSTTRTGATPASVAAITPMSVKYMRVVVNSSTNIDTYVSYEGHRWIACHTAFNPGFTVANAGLGISGNTGSVEVEALFDWIRAT